MKAYTLDHGTLTVHKDLRQDYDLSFDQALATLLASPEKDLKIDISYATYLSSTYVGMIAALFFQAHQQGKTLSVLARPSVVTVLKATGLGGFIQLMSADGDSAT